jgi:hypothetical protein
VRRQRQLDDESRALARLAFDMNTALMGGQVVNVTPPISSATVGDGVPGESGAKALASGDYMFQISYRERVHFGGLMLSRESSTAVPFSVR